jgi:hypothetical protein
LKVPEVSLYAAAIELGIDRKTLEKRIVASGLKPGHGQMHRWRDILKAVAADPVMERAGETRARRELLELELKERTYELISTNEVMSMWGHILLSIRQRFQALPSEAASQCNPTDPAHAYTALTEWTVMSNRLISQHLPQIVPGEPGDEVEIMPLRAEELACIAPVKTET